MLRSIRWPSRVVSLLAPLVLLEAAGSVHAAGDLENVVRPFLARHCTRCHGEDVQKAKLRLDVLPPRFDDAGVAARWVEVMDRLHLGEMPPEDEPRPRVEDIRAVTRWIAAELRAARRAGLAAGGRVPLRRLNRSEYANTVRDLLGVRFDGRESPVDRLPPDGKVDGFDKVATGLSIDPTLLEEYLSVAELILERAIATGPPPVPTARLRFELEETIDHEAIAYIARLPSARVQGEGLELFDGVARTYGRLLHPHDGRLIPVAGRYTVRLGAGADAGRRREPVRLRLTRRGEGVLLETEVTAPVDRPETFEVTRAFSPDGGEEIQVGIVNGTRAILPDYYVVEVERAMDAALARGDTRTAARLQAALRAEGGPSQGRPNPAMAEPSRLPRLFLDYIEIEGPLYESWPPASHERIFFERDGVPKDLAYARRIIERLLPRAYRRPASREEVDAVVAIAAAELAHGEPFEEAVKAALTGVLCSPSFLYLFEPSGDAEPRALDDFELATRLSYFLWSSMPDDELFDIAREGRLGEPSTRAAQVDRLLADPRASALTDGFATQWLRIDEFDRFEPDRRLYPEYYRPANASLGEDMKTEAHEYFRRVLNEDRSVLDFVASDWTMLNERLARFYGVPGVTGDAFRPVELPAAARRGGVVTMAGFHKWGSDGSRTRPIERGKYVLDVIFNDPPDPPPPNVGEVEPNVEGESLTVRERLERHKTIEACASCHRTLDPYGLALENFNAIGLWRDRQDGEKSSWGGQRAPAIDASGVLPDGTSFRDFGEFRAALLAQEERFLRGLAGKLLTYALGRGVHPSDRSAIDEVVAAARANGRTLRAMVHAIVASEEFRTK